MSIFIHRYDLIVRVFLVIVRPVCHCTTGWVDVTNSARKLFVEVESGVKIEVDLAIPLENNVEFIHWDIWNEFHNNSLCVKDIDVTAINLVAILTSEEGIGLGH